MLYKSSPPFRRPRPGRPRPRRFTDRQLQLLIIVHRLSLASTSHIASRLFRPADHVGSYVAPAPQFGAALLMLQILHRRGAVRLSWTGDRALWSPSLTIPKQLTTQMRAGGRS
jgi:hypothetical protein